MTRSDEGMIPEHENDSAQDERDAEQSPPRGDEHDPTRHPAPPGNPEADDEAVEKGEEQIGRVVGR
jgi:hypothetical protein